jgi:hypothetical protein
MGFGMEKIEHPKIKKRREGRRIVNRDKKTMYVVGKFLSETDRGTAWEIEGVYDDRKRAESACIGLNFFVGPIPLNISVGTDGAVWPNCYYPMSVEK